MAQRDLEEIVHNPDSRDHFEVLGIPRKLRVDQEQLTRHFYRLSRLYHPDYNQSLAPADRVRALQRSAAVNEAFNTLKDPYKRGRWWLEFNGGRIDENMEVPQDLILLVFEVQDDLRAIGDTDDASFTDRIAERRREVEEALRVRRETLLTLFQKWDNLDNGSTPNGLRTDTQRVLADISYLSALIRDIKATLENVSAA